MSSLFRDSDRPSVSLRGWLSDVYFQSIATGVLQGLAVRLGGRATVDDPLFGRAAGLVEIEALLKKAAAWFAEHNATYERERFTTGADRDVTEGQIHLSGGASLPVAVVAERRKSREVELRIYFAASAIMAGVPARGVLAPAESTELFPDLARNLLAALKKGDATAALAVFEHDATLRHSRGADRNPSDPDGAFTKLLLPAGWEIEPSTPADDGATCAFEYSRVPSPGNEASASGPKPGLLVLERGASGLFRSARMYDDF